MSIFKHCDHSCQSVFQNSWVTLHDPSQQCRGKIGSTLWWVNPTSKRARRQSDSLANFSLKGKVRKGERSFTCCTENNFYKRVTVIEPIRNSSGYNEVTCFLLCSPTWQLPLFTSLGTEGWAVAPASYPGDQLLCPPQLPSKRKKHVSRKGP